MVVKSTLHFGYATENTHKTKQQQHQQHQQNKNKRMVYLAHNQGKVT